MTDADLHQAYLDRRDQADNALYASYSRTARERRTRQIEQPKPKRKPAQWYAVKSGGRFSLCSEPGSDDDESMGPFEGPAGRRKAITIVVAWNKTLELPRSAEPRRYPGFNNSVKQNAALGRLHGVEIDSELLASMARAGVVWQPGER